MNFRPAADIAREQNTPKKSRGPDVCPLRDEEGYCIPSKTERPQGVWVCSGEIWETCGVYRQYKEGP